VKLIIAIVHKDDAGPVLDDLLRREYRATRINSSGGFLRQGNSTLLIGVEPADVDDVIAAIRATARPRTQAAGERPSASGGAAVEVRAATVFVLHRDGDLRV
jgi:uncharacterized protein YaaQ